MTGSVIDGEDVVQDAVVKALEALARGGPTANVEGWLFRIAHHAALDHLRRRARHEAARADKDLDTMVDPTKATEDRQIAAASLRTFMRLPVAQRSCVILKDVLGYTIEEVGTIIDASVPAVKAALHRGRARLRALADEPDERTPPVLAAAERARLAAYVDRFNARDFDAVRDMLADDVRLDLVGRLRTGGRAKVGTYLHNYERADDWHLSLGFVDRRPAILVRDPRDAAGRPTHFVLLTWADERLAEIRDYRYARYVLDGAEVTILD